jgi:hypothetical protein
MYRQPFLLSLTGLPHHVKQQFLNNKKLPVTIFSSSQQLHSLIGKAKQL